MSLNYTLRCINASAGSGKTTHIVKQILAEAEKTQSFEHILCLTFSNAAAQELMNRIFQQNMKLPKPYKWNSSLACTLHAFCLTLLRRYNPHYQILTAHMQQLLWTKSLNACSDKLSHLSYKQLRELAKYTHVAYLSEELHDVYTLIHNTFTQYKTYESLISFDEIISHTQNLLIKDMLSDGLASALSNIKYLYIDESQDLSNTQWEIINSLINEIIQINHLDIILVGDQMQSIYSFQGANPRSYEIFQEVHHDIHLMHQSQGYHKQSMTHSYRYGTNITRLVNSIFDLSQTTLSTTKDRIEMWEPAEDWQDRICDKILMILEKKNDVMEKNSTKNDVTIANISQNQNESGSMKADNAKVQQAVSDKSIHCNDIMILIRKRNKRYLHLAQKLRALGIPVSYDENTDICKKILEILLNIIDMSPEKIALLESQKNNKQDQSKMNDTYQQSEKNKSYTSANTTTHPNADHITTHSHAHSHSEHASYTNTLADEALEINKSICSDTALQANTDTIHHGHIIDHDIDNSNATHDTDTTNDAANITNNSDASDDLLSPEQLLELYTLTNTPIALMRTLLNYLCLSQKTQHAILFQLTNFLIANGNSLYSCKLFFESSPHFDATTNNSVRIQTIHSTKGMEADVIFLCDTMQNPNFDTLSPNMSKDAALDEFKRLLYVALTRSKQDLIIVNNPETYKLSSDSWYSLIKSGMLKADI